jgi:hypothetical protein
MVITMQQIVVKLGLARKAVREFESEVNTLLAQGYTISEWKYEKKGLRVLLLAILDKFTDVTVE